MNKFQGAGVIDSARVTSAAAFATATEHIRCLIAHKGDGTEKSKAQRGQERLKAEPVVEPGLLCSLSAPSCWAPWGSSHSFTFN